MTDPEKKEGVYGENHPAEEDRGGSGQDIRTEISEKTENKGDTASDLEQAREEMQDETGSGGMGRSRTPKDGPSQGGWQRPEEPVESDG